MSARPLAERRFRFFGKEYDVVGVAATAALGLVGALVAKALGLPLPWLSGGLIAVASGALAGVTVRGQALQFPSDLRFFFVPIVGVAIGGAFTPALLDEAARWWPTFLALLLYTPLAHLIGYQIYRRLGGVDQITAFYGAMPGGFIEALTMGEERGADMPRLTLLQFARLILCIVSVPIIFSWVEGFTVGSAAGVEMEGSDVPIGLPDALILIAAGVLGVLGARRLRVPAALITGPILLSGLAHLTGLTATTPPAWMITLTQLVVGVSLGVRFVGLSRRVLRETTGLVMLNVYLLLGLAALFGVVLAPAVGESIEAVVLAFAPGGVVEMSLVAVSLQISVVYVAAHHVLRILAAVFLSAVGSRYVLPPAATSTSPS